MERYTFALIIISLFSLSDGYASERALMYDEVRQQDAIWRTKYDAQRNAQQQEVASSKEQEARRLDVLARKHCKWVYTVLRGGSYAFEQELSMYDIAFKLNVHARLSVQERENEKMAFAADNKRWRYGCYFLGATAFLGWGLAFFYASKKNS